MIYVDRNGIPVEKEPTKISKFPLTKKEEKSQEDTN